MFSDQQYDAAHNSAALIERSSQGTVALTGADRASFLHALLTNDIASLPKGRGVYAAYLTPQGRMISDMRVIETGSRLLLSVDRHVAAPLAERFETLIFSEDVQAKDASDIAVLGVHGPSSARMIQHATSVSVADLTSQYDNLTVESLTIVRDDALGVPGYDVYVPGSDRDAIRAKLIDAGAVPVSDDVAEALRIEAGRPLFGVDMTTDTIPLEAGIEDRAISFTKGCYVGQEVIVRMHASRARTGRAASRVDRHRRRRRARTRRQDSAGGSHGRRDHQRDRVTQGGQPARIGLCAARTRRGRHGGDGGRVTGSH